MSSTNTRPGPAAQSSVGCRTARTGNSQLEPVPHPGIPVRREVRG